MVYTDDLFKKIVPILNYVDSFKITRNNIYATLEDGRILITGGYNHKFFYFENLRI